MSFSFVLHQEVRPPAAVRIPLLVRQTSSRFEVTWESDLQSSPSRAERTRRPSASWWRWSRRCPRWWARGRCWPPASVGTVQRSDTAAWPPVGQITSVPDWSGLLWRWDLWPWAEPWCRTRRAAACPEEARTDLESENKTFVWCVFNSWARRLPTHLCGSRCQRWRRRTCCPVHLSPPASSQASPPGRPLTAACATCRPGGSGNTRSQPKMRLETQTGSSHHWPTPESVVQKLNRAVAHRCFSLSDQPVFVLWGQIKQLCRVYFEHFTVWGTERGRTFPCTLKLGSLGALVPLKLFWYCGAAVHGEWGAGVDTIIKNGWKLDLYWRKSRDMLAWAETQS